MKKLTRAECARWLLERDNFAILSHTRPDGDTVGSSAALCLGLRSLGKNAWVVENREVTQRFLWLHQGLTKPAAQPGDTLVSADVASPNMLPEDFRQYLGHIALRIDHHASATSFTDVELVDGNSASCAELVWDVLAIMNCVMNKQLAEAVYVGVSTDTGCFRFSNTPAHTFETAASCARVGARIYELNQELFETNTLGRLRIQGWIVDHMKLFADNTLAVCAIPRKVEQELGVSTDDMDNISNFPRTVAGVRIAATLRETEKGTAKLSVRAVPGYDATRITERFGGGGHRGAAGATIDLPLNQAAEAVEKTLTEIFG